MDSNSIEVGDVFTKNGQWYLKINDRQVRAVTDAQAHQIKRDRARTPRTEVPERPSQPGISQNPLQRNQYYDRAPPPVSRNAPEARSQPILRPREASQPAERTGGPNPRERSGEDSLASGLSALSFSEDPSRRVTNTQDRYQTGRGSRPDLALSSNQGSVPRDSTSNTPKFNVLSGVICYFVQIPENDYEQRAIFLSEHSELLRFDLNKIFLEALYQMLADESVMAKQCIGSLAIIRLCDNLKKHPHMIEKRVKALSDRASERSQLYREAFASIEEDLMDAVETQISKRDSYPGPTKPGTTQDGTKKSGPIKPIKSQPQMSTDDLIDSLSENLSVAFARSPGALYIPPEQFADDGMQKLSSSYKIQSRAAAFFVPGRVFSMLWHEAAGQRARPRKVTDQLSEPSEDYIRTRLADQNTTIGAYGQEIFSHIRRFVVIRARNAYCWCISIGTYGGQGMKKRGLKEDDIHSHTIIYDSKKEPLYLRDEPEMSKRSIAVVLRQGQTLSSASRLHYGKPSTIEFNTPVQDVGMIDKKDLPILLSEVANELLPEQRDQPPPRADRN